MFRQLKCDDRAKLFPVAILISSDQERDEDSSGAGWGAIAPSAGQWSPWVCKCRAAFLALLVIVCAAGRTRMAVMGTSLRVLIVEDSSEDALLMARELKRGGYEPQLERVDTAEAMRAALDAKQWDVILADYALPKFSGPEALKIVQEKGLDVPFLIVSGAVGEELAVEVMRAGAHDYIMKDNLIRLLPAVKRELADAEVRRNRKRAEQSLRASEENFRNVIAKSADGAVVVDKNGVVCFMNPVAEALLGRKRSGLLGEPFGLALAPGETRELKLAGDGREPTIAEVRVVDTEWEGQLAYLVSLRDVTDRKQAALEMARLARFPSEDPNPVLRVSQDGMVLYANTASKPVLDLFKCRVGGYLKRHWRQEVANVLKTGVSKQIEVKCKEHNFCLAFVPVTGADYVNVYGRDITEQRTLETQVRQAAQLESVGRLAGGIAHDFNNILTGISGYAQLLLAQVSEETPVGQDVRQIYSLANRAGELIRQLLALGRRQPIQPTVLNINALIENISPMLRRLIGEDIELVFALDPQLGNVRGDSAQIEQVLMNLAANSRDAMPHAGKFTIETSNVELDQEYASKHLGVKPGDYVLLAVRDTGCGMDDATLQHVFEPFFTTKERGKGTGLGLASVYGIVKQHEGSIWVYSEPGKGTTFKVYLPRVQVETGEAKRSGQVEEPSGGTETILVVEDDETIRELTGRILEELGYRALAAGKPSEAEAICRGGGERIALLLTDVVLPEQSGRELYGRLAQIEPGLKVLYVSGYGGESVVNHGLLPHDAPFLEKPFSPTDLARKLREVLDGCTATKTSQR